MKGHAIEPMTDVSMTRIGDMLICGSRFDFIQLRTSLRIVGTRIAEVTGS
jgi:hypothetical protein